MVERCNYGEIGGQMHVNGNKGRATCRRHQKKQGYNGTKNLLSRDSSRATIPSSVTCQYPLYLFQESPSPWGPCRSQNLIHSILNSRVRSDRHVISSDSHQRFTSPLVPLTCSMFIHSPLHK